MFLFGRVRALTRTQLGNFVLALSAVAIMLLVLLLPFLRTLVLGPTGPPLPSRIPLHGLLLIGSPYRVGAVFDSGWVATFLLGQRATGCAGGQARPEQRATRQPPRRRSERVQALAEAQQRFDYRRLHVSLRRGGHAVERAGPSSN